MDKLQLDQALQALVANNPTLPGMMGMKTPATANVPMAFTPANYLETWPAGEEGGKIPRPIGLPIDKPSIELPMNPPRPDYLTTKNVVADYVSHIMTNPSQQGYSPQLANLYNQYVKGLDPKVQQDRYQWEVQNSGEKRPYEAWLQASGAPAMMRGHVFDQWLPEDNRRLNSPEQLQILDQIKSLLGL